MSDATRDKLLALEARLDEARFWHSKYGARCLRKGSCQGCKRVSELENRLREESANLSERAAQADTPGRSA